MGIFPGKCRQCGVEMMVHSGVFFHRCSDCQDSNLKAWIDKSWEAHNNAPELHKPTTRLICC